MPRPRYRNAYPTQNAAEPTNPTAPFWRRSCLCGPQMAGIPTTFNDDEVPQLDNWNHTDSTEASGVMEFVRSKRRK